MVILVGLTIFPLVVFPSIVEFVPLVMLISRVLMFCAFTESRLIIAKMPIIITGIGMTKANCFLIAFLSVLLPNKALEW